MDGADRLARLKERYHASLPDKSIELKDKWQAVNASGFAPAALMELSGYIHKFAGSTGMYGYHALAKSARRLEEDLRNPLPEDVSWQGRVAQQVQFLLRALDNPQQIT